MRKTQVVIILLISNILAVSILFFFYNTVFSVSDDYIISNTYIGEASKVVYEKEETEEKEEVFFEYATSKDYNETTASILSVATGDAMIDESVEKSVIDVLSIEDLVCVQVSAIPVTENNEYELFLQIDSDSASAFEVRIISESQDVMVTRTLMTNSENRIIFNTVNISGEKVLVYLCFSEKAVYELKDIHLVSQNEINTIAVNQLGYLPDMDKIACFRESEGTYFEILKADTDEVVYKGLISAYGFDEKTGEAVAYGDFSDFSEKGDYYIRSQYGNLSYVFTIDEGIYNQLTKEVLRMISSQRCGVDLPESIYGDLAHEACHTGTVQAIELGFELVVNGGWHDAGDYGKYTSTTDKTTMDLMMAYLLGENLYSDDMNILDSGNGVSDILDEIRVGCDYLKRIQLNDGSVFEKIITKSFAEWTLPESDTNQLYAFPPTTINTAYTAGILMIASEIFAETDPDYAEDCRESAMNAISYVESRGFLGIREFDEFSNNGHYSDREDLTERYFMYMVSGLIMDDDYYIGKAIEMMEENDIDLCGLDYYNPSAYASYLFVKWYQGELYSDYIDILTGEFVEESNKIIDTCYQNAYLNSNSDYYWGSNYHIADNGIILGFTYDLTGEKVYKDARDYQLHYILGNNILGISFVCGFGDVYPQNVHHRIGSVNDTLITGAMVGGSNQDREIIEDSDYSIEEPAKDYIDAVYSYSTNEVAIYYNSSLELLLALIN